jgi:hypothetical protein
MQLSFLLEYIPLIVSVFLIILAIILHIVWFRKPRKELKIENKLSSYLRKGPIEKGQIVSLLIQSDPSFLFTLLYQKLTSLRYGSDTFQRFVDVLMEQPLLDRIVEVYHQGASNIDSSNSVKTSSESTSAVFHSIMRIIKDPRTLSLLQSELDRSEISNVERMEIVKSLFCIQNQVGWLNALSVPSHAIQFTDFEKEYLFYMEEFLAKYPITDIELQKLPPESLEYFHQLIFSPSVSNAILGLHITIKLNKENVEETIQKRLEAKDNPHPIQIACMEALRDIGTDRAAKILYDFIQSPCVQDSSKLIQKAFSCLQDMQEVGQPYIVLAAHSKIPIIKVMAESFLHLSTL